MPLQNRVTPDAQIITAPWRGGFMGNRGGRIHDPATRTLLKRKWASKRWISCVLEFKNRQRVLMGEGYTELFFLDEVSALSAGHRPCFECRRADANHFTSIWENAFGTFASSRADAMDKILHEQRIGENTFLSSLEAEALPDGAMVKSNNDIFARKNNTWLKWSGNGYQEMTFSANEVELITPPAIVEILRHGYKPCWHESAS